MVKYIVVKPVETQPVLHTIKSFAEARNKVLVLRKSGGIGDILMHRMLFEDMKNLCPEIKIHFAIPHEFSQLAEDHPYIDTVVDCNKIRQGEYLAVYDTTHSCGNTEMAMAPMPGPHRSDIWAGTIGVELKNHNMHLTIRQSERDKARDMVARISGGKPTIAFTPVSTTTSKSLDENQIKGVLSGLWDLGYFVYILHWRYLDYDAPTLIGSDMRNFIALVDAANFVISVDSATFHIAGGVGKPQVGIFSWACGVTYGKYYSHWELVQRHRKDGNWDCGPCYKWSACPKSTAKRKPCITEITSDEIVRAFERVSAK